MNKDELKKWAAARVKFFLEKAEEANDPFELEAMFYSIARVAEHAKDKFHEIHEKSNLPF